MNEEQVEEEARNCVGGSEREQKVQYKHEKRVSKYMRGAKHMFRAAESKEMSFP